MNRLLHLGHSPDPDDAFMFYALAQQPPRIDTRGWQFRHVLQDIQTLNRRAMRGELEVSAISIHAFPYVADRYALMSCGSSMGDGYGPMIVTRHPLGREELAGRTVAIPGKLTTAFLTCQLWLAEAGLTAVEGHAGPDRVGFRVAMFDEIPSLVASGEVDAGLLIHEGQLTFGQLGLHLTVDLGVWWQGKTGLPLPLGGNVIRRDLGRDSMDQITAVLRASIRYSLEHRDVAVTYALQFGRELDHQLADRFVGMYVNDWTIDYGPRGRDAIRLLLGEGARTGLVPPIGEIEFVAGL